MIFEFSESLNPRFLFFSPQYQAYFFPPMLQGKMSVEGGCEGEMGDKNLQAASQDSGQSGDPAVPPTPTSRISVKQDVDVI